MARALLVISIETADVYRGVRVCSKYGIAVNVFLTYIQLCLVLSTMRCRCHWHWQDVDSISGYCIRLACTLLSIERSSNESRIILFVLANVSRDHRSWIVFFFAIKHRNLSVCTRVQLSPFLAAHIRKSHSTNFNSKFQIHHLSRRGFL